MGNDSERLRAVYRLINQQSALLEVAGSKKRKLEYELELEALEYFKDILRERNKV